VLTAELEAQVMREIIEPTVATMAAAGMPYSGVLYAGLMLTAEGPKLIEYNARFGDPECQVLMLRLEDDLLTLMLAIAEGGSPSCAPQPLAEHRADRGDGGQGLSGHARRKAARSRASSRPRRRAPRSSRPAPLEGRGGLVANGGRVSQCHRDRPDIGEARDTAYAAVDALDFASGFLPA
jgi:phosphoribosylamine--glycine ligase